MNRKFFRVKFLSAFFYVSLTSLLFSCTHSDKHSNDRQISQVTCDTLAPYDHSKDITVRIPYRGSIINLEFVYVEGGTFYMGGTSEQGNDAKDDEYPVNEITLSDFYVSKYEVTQEVWEAVTQNKIKDLAQSISELPNKEGKQFPMHYISWWDCQIFLTYLNDMFSSQIGQMRFSFLSEAQWEYAARGGKYGTAKKYSGSDNINDVAVFWKNSGENYIDKKERKWSYDRVMKNRGHLSEVGSKQPNELGIYDMSGNVSEWCADYYHPYMRSKNRNPIATVVSSYQVQRGGNWSSPQAHCRVSARHFELTAQKSHFAGLRVAIIK